MINSSLLRRLGLLLVLFVLACGNPDDQQIKAKPVSLYVPHEQLAWDVAGADGRQVVTKHYKIFTTVRDDKFRQTLAGFMEVTCDTCRELTGLPEPDARMPMYMLETRQQWVSLTQGMFGKRGPAEMLENGGYTYHGVTVCWNIGRIATYAVAAHEAMHQYLYYNTKNALPIWVEEGLATNMEGMELYNGTVRFTPDNNTLRLTALSDAFYSSKALPVKTLLQTSPARIMRTKSGDVLQYYSQVYALINFIRNDPNYKAGWSRMLADAHEGKLMFAPGSPAGKLGARTGQIAEKVFQYYITSDYPTFNIRYNNHIRKLLKLRPQKAEN